MTVKQQYNPKLTVLGILLTMLDLRTSHNRQIASVVNRSFEGKVRVFETIIRESVGFKESSKAGVSVLRLNPGSLAAMSYRSLANEVISASEQMQLLNSIKGDDITAREAGQLQEAASVALAQAESMIRGAWNPGDSRQRAARACQVGSKRATWTSASDHRGHLVPRDAGRPREAVERGRRQSVRQREADRTAPVSA